uniref:Putative secreted protein n=1 Tax=Anopheles marajoara TaxID=58244 RepID=A0A2M4CEQ3_9DIPT
MRGFVRDTLSWLTFLLMPPAMVVALQLGRSPCWQQCSVFSSSGGSKLFQPSSLLSNVALAPRWPPNNAPSLV